MKFCFSACDLGRSFRCVAMASVVAGVLLAPGCAARKARKQLESVAKGWCETIRASQVIPVYPLTEDLLVGDVFLVETPISEQASLYRQKGFLPLDAAQVRLPYTNFSNVYFDGYWDWKTAFGGTPHPSLTFSNAGSFSGTGPQTFLAAPLPRAAFPTYSFKAKSGFGLNAAFPIQGVPVALSYLNTDQVDGTVTIADARTYAGDQGELLRLLLEWRSRPEVGLRLANAARQASPKRIFLRVLTRVYYARAVDVTLRRSESTSVGGKGGTVNEVTLPADPDESAFQTYSNRLGVLNSSLSLISNAVPQIGASVKFVGAGSSVVGLSQAFDRLLAIGYLGFDVEVFENGTIGSPIPTFQRVTEGKNGPSVAVAFGQDESSAILRAWIKADPAHRGELEKWLDDNGLAAQGLTSIVNGSEHAVVRGIILHRFKISSSVSAAAHP